MALPLSDLQALFAFAVPGGLGSLQIGNLTFPRGRRATFWRKPWQFENKMAFEENDSGETRISPVVAR